MNSFVNPDPNGSGIYKILNKANGKFYIGSSKCIRVRLGQHLKLLRKGTHHSRHLQSSWNKYGESQFEFIIVENCEIHSLALREQYYIDTLLPAYNVALIAYNTAGIVWTEESRRNLSNAKIGKCSGIDNPMFGKKHSERTKSIISQKNSGKIKSITSIEKMRDTICKKYKIEGHKHLGKKNKNSPSKSPYYGVHSLITRGKYIYWSARISVNGKRVYLGTFKDEISAAMAYDFYIQSHKLDYPCNFGGV